MLQAEVRSQTDNGIAENRNDFYPAIAPCLLWVWNDNVLVIARCSTQTRQDVSMCQKGKTLKQFIWQNF